MNKKKIDVNENKFLFDIKGLSLEEVEKKIKNNQNNVSLTNLNKSTKDIIFSNIFTLFNFLLLIIAFIIFYIKHYEQLFFLFINSLNIFLNIFQEIKAKNTLDKISLLKLNYTKVIREGCLYEIPIDNVVTEDVLFLELGSQIVADSKIQKGTLEVDESFLTGESQPVFKKEGDFLYSGSYVISGNACSNVVYVGQKTYISKLTQEAKKYKKIRTPLIECFTLLVRIIISLLIPITLILFFCPEKIGIQDDDRILGICGFILGVMPSGLFLLTSITLLVGFIKLVQKKAYMRDLFGIEMLAHIDILCLDKTGTITNGDMTVQNVLKYSDFNFNLDRLMFEIVNTLPNNNPTQNALYQKFSFLNKKTKDNNYKILQNQSFSSNKKYSVIEFENLGTFLLGAPEFILKKQFYQIQKDVQKQTQLGYRVLLLAQTDVSLSNINDNIHYKIISLISLEDTIKSDALDTINYFTKNGIKIKIISGDSPETIFYIAKKLNIISHFNQTISLMNLTKEELERASMEYDVFGRATPEQKKNIIQNLKKNNFKVGMIGDGANDISAFKESDISIAMASGNEASKNVANLVLIDSQFSSLTKVVSEGRRVINNLQKISILFLVKTILFFLLAIITIFLNFLYKIDLYKSPLPFPLKPLQFNLFDTFFIGIPSFFLALEMNNKKINKSFFKNILRKSSIYSLIIAIFYLLLIFLPNISHISNYLTLFCSFIFFYLFIRNCLPFNKWKFILAILTTIGFIFVYSCFNLEFVKEICKF